MDQLTIDRQEVQAYIQALVDQYKWKKIPEHDAKIAMEFFRSKIPEGWNLAGDQLQDLYTLKGTKIASGYSRVVIGHYGAYVEIPKNQIRKSVLICEPGQEYRYQDPQFKDRVKYYWYSVDDGSGVKIYYQQREVDYADYKVRMFYISPHELKLIV